MGEVDRRGREIVPLTEQDKADLDEVRGFVPGAERDPLVEAWEKVTGRILEAHGFDPDGSRRLDPDGVLWGRKQKRVGI